MNILSTLFIIVFSIMQVKSENVLFDSNDCETKCPIRRQTIRSYPPGTALFVGDECVCGRAQETIYEYVPPVVQSVGNVEIPVGFKPKTSNEHRSNNRVMGNYGSLVFSGNVQILNLLSIKNEDIHKGCCDRKPSNPSSDNLIMNKPVVNLTTTKSGLNEKNTTPSDVEKCTDKDVSIITEPVLQNSFTGVTSDITSENIVTDESDLSDESESLVALTSLDVEIQTSTVNPKQNENCTASTVKDSMTSTEKIVIRNDPNDLFGTTDNNSYHNNKPDLEILIINSNTINFNNQQRFRLKTL
ncbi:uncharacterized protein LOC132953045 [Metopolophium dirhodum]|uniref:uncharacterized protein LOC132953045 n=1 Tax=Metopolophium dirhodum TaxID=44670 RepID=UPI00298F8450|nr:uncharacterized protein LOC132953045 [Metopolophium dirhodum]